MATLTRRDQRVVALVNAFGQLTSKHVRALVFADNASMTPCNERLKKLAQMKMLSRVERRLVGGDGGGSGLYAYQLGPAGWKLCGREGKYWGRKSIDHHALAIADVFVMLKEAETAGQLVVAGVLTEPDCWETVGGESLKPDMLIEVELPALGKRRLVWLEVDLGTERQRHITEKLDRYVRAYKRASHDFTFPQVVFVTPDSLRADALRWLMGRRAGDYEALFRVVDNSEFMGLFVV
ncbi:MAG: replication-relaxation family protein [Ornithinimicrobium sp.]